MTLKRKSTERRLGDLDGIGKAMLQDFDPSWLSTHGENFLDQIMQARDIKYPKGGRKVPEKEIQKVCSS